MELAAINRIYFVGIGGIGMSALARYFAKRGAVVCGYDKTRTDLTIALEREGILISYMDDDATLPVCFLDKNPDTLVVYTPAIPKNSTILNYFQQNGFALKKRSEVLGIISKGQFCIAVAGTHGKTTTSSIIAHILTDTGYGCTAFLGGIATNYGSNFLLSDKPVVVVEADEYDRSFLTLHPDLAVITSMDADHLDIYGDSMQLQESFRLFAGQLKPGGTLFLRSGLPISEGVNYSLDPWADIKGLNIRIVDGCFEFDYVSEEVTIEGIRLMLPGRHNIENAVAAIGIALKLGIEPEAIRSALASFKGVKRRFEIQVNTKDHVYIDDYAHHPEELRACFAAVRELYPERKLTVVFQPHLFSRTKDFAADFAQVLSTVDDLLLLEIYPARELPIPGIDSAFLLDQITLDSKIVCAKGQVVDLIKAKQPELLLTVGAGDIDTLVQPLKNVLSHA
ncbi:UDP-N-acetylmuramate--L-alanine ligase [Pedobacter duraquae]|uniref:UDP-N-acetylmuramate--L-alanine ligase n=1 Tax=Pedobacter duraquae TaxID=425511 RepID=A0A4R6ILR3_9SPHI|nr:UDP-N-acetylmuramate--L-alanine ligase [Pedobacter duraquae]TDO23094.1 UDP-N-acetylmuramate--L-alanine ligase [Pedobacter duraquae]